MAEADSEAPFCGLQCLGTIGSGAFGAVHLVQNIEGDQFAVKVMEMCRASATEREVARNEVRVLRLLKHDHVIIYVDSLSHEGKLYVITEVCAGGDLNGFLEQMTRPVPESLLLVWLWQMACGLEYMHTTGPTPILHRDLKPSNVYLTEAGDIRLGDMGIARILEAPNALAETFCGSPSYMSPEVLFELPYNAQTDVWSLGCIVAKMLTLKSAYKGSSLDVLRSAVLMGPPEVPEGVSSDLRCLLTDMLKVRYRERPSATNVLDKDFLQHCENMQSFPLLLEHQLLDKLGMRLDQPSSSSSSSSSSSFFSTFSTMSLSHSSSPPKLDLNNGEKVREYYEKKRTREQGRKKGRRTFSKTKKKKLVTVLEREQSQTVTPENQGTSGNGGDPGGAAGTAWRGAAQQDVSLSRALLSSFTLSVSSVQSRSLRPQGQPQAMGLQMAANLCPPGDIGSSPMAQMKVLKSVLVEILGEDVWNKACVLIKTVQSPTDLQAMLDSLLGDLSELSQILTYCFITDSIRTSPHAN